MKPSVTITRSDYIIAWLTAFAITIHILESALPSPVPGIKPGLANVITVVVLIRYGWRTAIWVVLLRVLIGSLLQGTFLTPTFILSFTGAVCGMSVLALAAWISQTLPPLALGALGYSVLASMAHMYGQFWSAYLLFIPHQALFRLLPVLMTAAVIFGLLSGIIARILLKRIHCQEYASSAPISRYTE